MVFRGWRIQKGTHGSSDNSHVGAGVFQHCRRMHRGSGLRPQLKASKWQPLLFTDCSQSLPALPDRESFCKAADCPYGPVHPRTATRSSGGTVGEGAKVGSSHRQGTAGEILLHSNAQTNYVYSVKCGLSDIADRVARGCCVLRSCLHFREQVAAFRQITRAFTSLSYILDVGF